MVATFYIALAVIALFFLRGIRVVPQQQAWIVERFGRFARNLEAGLHFVVPFVDKVAYRHSLKEVAIDVHEQTAVTQDNVSVKIDGILYMRVVDPKLASYGVLNPKYALTQLAQTTLRSEVGKIPLDRTFEERVHLNEQVCIVLNQAAKSWGIECMRHEVKNISMPDEIRKAMELQMTAERQKRARILESEGFRQAAINDSEGKRQAEINIAEGNKQRLILESEGEKERKINQALAEAESIKAVANATAKGITTIGLAAGAEGGSEAIAFRVAQEYIGAFSNIAKEGNTVLLPSNAGDIRSMVAQAFSIYDGVKGSGASLEKIVKK